MLICCKLGSQGDSSSSSALQAISLGFAIMGEIFAYVTVSLSRNRGSHILSSWMVHAGCVFVANTHLSRTWMSGSFESVQWHACVHRLDLGLYSSKRVLGNGVRTHENPLYQGLLLTYLCPSLPVEYRPSTTPRHRTLFWTALVIPDQLVPCCFIISLLDGDPSLPRWVLWFLVVEAFITHLFYG